MAKPADTSVQAFLRENPEYNISRLMEQSEKMENVPLREGAPSSLAAVRGQVPRRVRMDQAMKISQDAYRKWARRRSGALSYGSQPSVSEHLGDIQSQYGQEGYEADLQRRKAGAVASSELEQDFADSLEQDTGLSGMEGSEDTGLSERIPFSESGYTQDVSGMMDSSMDKLIAPTLQTLIEHQQAEDVAPDWLKEQAETIVEGSIDDMIEYNKNRADWGLDPLQYKFDEETGQLTNIPGATEEALRAQEVRKFRTQILKDL
jgi:hypothetical protein